MNLIAENLTYKPGEQFHLKNVSFNFKKGNLYTILGRTLSGKTTLLKTIAGLLNPDSGFIKFEDKNFESILISSTGYTGSKGFEIYIKNNFAENLWKESIKLGKKHGIQPIGLGARDTLRLEMGFCLHGNDIDETINPIEAGLGWICKKNFECR